MSEYYKGKVKVIGEDMMCFPADSKSLESLSCGCYDPYAWTDLDKDAVENISIGTWELRMAERRDQEWEDHYKRLRNELTKRQ